MDVNLVSVGNNPLGQLRDTKLAMKYSPIIGGASITRLIHDYDSLPLHDNSTFVIQGHGETVYDWNKNQ